MHNVCASYSAVPMKVSLVYLKKTLCLFLCAVVVANPCFAWSDAGHRIIASIAFRQLTKNQQEKVASILEKHPRFTNDFRIEEGNDKAESIFQLAAIWPDTARAFKGDDRRFHHSTWHYINLPIAFAPDQTGKDKLLAAFKSNQSLDPPAQLTEEMNIVQTIRFARQEVASPTVPDSEKAVWLCWIFHNIGDLHQPLHSCALVSEATPKGDRGGNEIKTKPNGNLHAQWDKFPGGDVKFRTAKNRAIEIASEVVKETKIDEEAWLLESFKVANEVVYSREVLRHIEAGNDGELQLTQEYLKAGGNASKERLKKAGVRLGLVLDELYR